MSGEAGAIIIMKQNKYIDLFNNLKAIDEEHSVALNDIGVRRGLVFNRMIAKGVFVECNDGKFYINNQTAINFKES